MTLKRWILIFTILAAACTFEYVGYGHPDTTDQETTTTAEPKGMSLAAGSILGGFIVILVILAIVCFQLDIFADWAEEKRIHKLEMKQREIELQKLKNEELELKRKAGLPPYSALAPPNG